MKKKKTLATKRRRGRPPRSDREAATKRLDLRLTPSEFNAIADLARDQGRPLAAAARQVLITHAICHAERPVDFDDDDEPTAA